MYSYQSKSLTYCTNHTANHTQNLVKIRPKLTTTHNKSWWFWLNYYEFSTLSHGLNIQSFLLPSSLS